MHSTEAAACDSALNKAKADATLQAAAAMATPPKFTELKCQCKSNQAQTQWSCSAFASWRKGN
jgi:hypothetical protein